MLTITDIFHAFQVFAAAQAAQFLMQDGMPLAAYRRWLERKMFEWQNGWITKPMGLCAPCFTGQVALWSGLLLFAVSAENTVFQAAVKIILFISFNFLFLAVWQKTQQGQSLN